MILCNANVDTIKYLPFDGPFVQVSVLTANGLTEQGTMTSRTSRARVRAERTDHPEAQVHPVMRLVCQTYLL